MLDTIVQRVTQKASVEPQKAVTGPGASVMSWGTPIDQVLRDENRVLREALTVYRTNRWINRAESVISARVGGVKWHLEDDNGDEVNDESPEPLRVIRDLFEKPLGDQQMAMAYPSQPSTRRASWGLTSRHMGLCNVGFWHLDELDRAMGFPKRIFYIRPDRLTPKLVNGTLSEWRLDATADGGGTPLSLEEILPFYLDQPDKGFFGIGLPESIWSTLPMPSAIDGHALDTLGSGGRLPGVYSPKEPMSDEIYARMQTDLRVLKDMPDSAKRDLVAKVPMEFTPTAADMASLNVILLSNLSRDDTLTHWGVPLSTIGGQSAAGMNSGETRKYDEAALWQNAVQFRIDALRETIQLRLLDRLQVAGMNVQLIIETPAFDDDAPRYTTAASATNLPLTNNERRALVGLPPLPGPLGMEVRLPMTIQAIGEVPEEDDASAEMGAAKARLDAQLDAVRKVSTDRIKRDLGKVLDEMKSEVAGKVRAKADHLAKKPSDSFTWWNEPKWRSALEKVLTPHLERAAESVGAKVQGQLGKSGKADVLGSAVLARLMKAVGKRITGILDTTRDDVQRLIAQGLDEGLGAAQLGDLIEQGTTFNELRAETIARTETATVLNQAAAETYREYGVESVQIIDGDEDDECAAANGQTWSLDDFNDNPIGHPNCVRDAIPIVGAA